MANSFLIVIIFILFSSVSYAIEPITYKDFISITNNALDALDQVEAVFMDSDALKIEARSVMQKYKATLNKYERYVQTWPEGLQGEIVFALEMTALYYKSTLNGGLYGESHHNAKFFADKARKLFKLYREGEGKVNRSAYKKIVDDIPKDEKEKEEKSPIEFKQKDKIDEIKHQYEDK